MATEEDIKNKVIMPFMRSLGFEGNELDFEKSFFIRVGRSTIKIDTEEQIRSLQPRLDILVKRNGVNLFIIEVKTDNARLTEDDREQAISYARLVHPIAPIAVVTNGEESILYKVGDKTEIAKNKASILGYQIQPDIDEIYQEALQYFIGYSLENVRAFCKEQVADRMSTLLGSREKPDRKFIPELYVASERLSEAIRNFLRGNKKLFALVGESGSGKTCSMCGLSRSSIDEHPILFYQAGDLVGSLAEIIAEDFNWTFSGATDDIAIFKRLDRMFSKTKPMLIFVDGVDGWTSPNKVAILSNFVRHIRNLNFKLIISCKEGQWGNFLSESGIPTLLADEVDPPNGYHLRFSTENEFFELVKRYKAFYGFKGLFEHNVFEECKRLPFLLRVFFEVAEKTQSPHLTFSIKEFYEKYLELIIERIPLHDRGVALETVKEIAKIIFEKKDRKSVV
jgi:hypothetical protein